MTAGRSLPGVDPRLLRVLDLPVTRRLDGQAAGRRAGRRAGPGSEILTSRRWVDGDDSRAVDWNATARTGDLHVKATVRDVAVAVHVIVDDSASLRFGTAGRKSTAAAQAATLLTAIALWAQEPVTVHTGHAFRTAVRNSRRDLPKLLDVLTEAPSWGQAGHLAGTLTRLHTQLTAPAVVIVITDAWLPDRDRQLLTEMALRHSVSVVEVLDPAELDLPVAGRLRMVDPETGATVVVNTSDAELRLRYREAVAEMRARTARDLAVRGIPVLVVRTDEDVTAALAGQLPRRRS